MSFINKFAWSGVAVVLAAVLALGLMSQTASAATTVAAGAKTVSIATNTATGTGACTILSSLVLSEAAATDTTNGQTFILTTPAGWSWCSAGSVAVASVSGAAPATAFPTVAVVTTSATVLTATTTGVSATNPVKFTWSSLGIRPDTAASATGNVALTGTGATAAPAAIVITAAGSMTGAYTITPLRLLAPGTTCDATGMALYATQPQIVPADGSAAWVICGLVLDDSSNAASGAGVTFTVSLGIVSTGTAKSVLAVSNSTGYVTTTYRGQGNVSATDTVVATYSLKNAVATQSVTLVPASGGTASKIVVATPQSLAIAASITDTSPNYVGSTVGTFGSLQVQDASGLGVNSQVVLISVDRGAIVAGQATTCVGGGVTAKSITATTATVAPLTGASTAAGTATFTVCANQKDAPGKITVTAQNISTTMANGTSTITQSGRPVKIAATVSGNTISVMVTDTAGNPVADATPVRFLISTNAGAVSPACAPTTNGAASGVAALNAATGTVIVTTDWNETGANASTCGTAAVAATNVASAVSGSAGAQTLQSTVSLPSGTTSGGTTTPPVAGAGSISSGSVPAAGGFGLIVASGDIKGVVTASGCPAASAAFWATVNGNFVTYVPGTTITAVNADFLAASPNGILPAATPLIAKCK